MFWNWINPTRVCKFKHLREQGTLAGFSKATESGAGKIMRIVKYAHAFLFEIIKLGLNRYMHPPNRRTCECCVTYFFAPVFCEFQVGFDSNLDMQRISHGVYLEH